MTNDKRDDVFESVRVKRTHLREQIADSVQELIAAGSLQQGAELPPERNLAEHFGVSRGTLREAIRVLEQRGLLSMKPGSGTYVTNVPPLLVADSIERYFAFSSCSHENLIDLREILEPEVAARAAIHRTPDDLAKLGQLVDKIEETFSGNDMQSYAEADAKFHVALGEATHNDLIVAITSGLQRIMRVWIEAQSRSLQQEKGAYSHRAIYDAVVAQDADQVREAMRVHMIVTRESLLHESPDP